MTGTSDEWRARVEFVVHNAMPKRSLLLSTPLADAISRAAALSIVAVHQRGTDFSRLGLSSRLSQLATELAERKGTLSSARLDVIIADLEAPRLDLDCDIEGHVVEPTEVLAVLALRVAALTSFEAAVDLWTAFVACRRADYEGKLAGPKRVFKGTCQVPWRECVGVARLDALASGAIQMADEAGCPLGRAQERPSITNTLTCPCALVAVTMDFGAGSVLSEVLPSVVCVQARSYRRVPCGWRVSHGRNR
mmetsp:Transcript_8695/g.35841  ORF Transcript_8695/g.35841 Transcript_8695/m.35841 type:complete len:250 (+) Transcript_8695:1206-1955(+)